MTTKAEVVTILAEKLNTTKVNVNLFMDAYEEAIMNSLKKGSEVPLLGIGKLRIGRTKARTQKVPTGAIVDIPAKNVIKLSVTTEAKTAVNTAPAKKVATVKAVPAKKPAAKAA